MSQKCPSKASTFPVTKHITYHRTEEEEQGQSCDGAPAEPYWSKKRKADASSPAPPPAVGPGKTPRPADADDAAAEDRRTSSQL